MKNDNSYLFSEMPVSKAVLTLAVPTVISQLINVVYNMADTFFIGQMNDPAQVAAATVAMPAFMLLTAFANLFGLGGSSFISRSLGNGDKSKARHCAAFCIWAGMGAALLYGILVVAFEPIIFPILGASDEIWDYCRQYVFWTIGIGALPTVMNAELAHLLRAEGYSRQAGFGVAFGGILNIALDPVFIFLLGMKIQGAAIATMLSNLSAMAYFFLFLYRIRKNTVITPNPHEFSCKYGILREVITVGLPGFIMTMMSTVSNAVLNHIVAGYSSTAIAGMGIAKKIDLLAYAIAQGMTQGTLPLIGYNFTSGNKKRMHQAIRAAFTYNFGVASIGAVLLFVLAAPISKCFIADAETVNYGKTFLKIICLACPTTAINFMVITVFQAVGKKVQPLFLSLLRKGSIDVCFMLLLNYAVEITGIAWATPIAYWVAFFISAILYLMCMKQMKAET
ncbi:MAG: MATE family efflux transporter [Ruminococcus sp.]|nr:MATE family efflux transporter [Ruminococcus sp.]